MIEREIMIVYTRQGLEKVIKLSEINGVQIFRVDQWGTALHVQELLKRTEDVRDYNISINLDKEGYYLIIENIHNY